LAEIRERGWRRVSYTHFRIANVGSQGSAGGGKAAKWRIKRKKVPIWYMRVLTTSRKYLMMFGLAARSRNRELPRWRTKLPVSA
jgi:hypothetical protein